MNTFCPTCLEPVNVPVNAREGRHFWCRPQPVRRHSTPPTAQSWFRDFVNDFHANQ